MAPQDTQSKRSKQNIKRLTDLHIKRFTNRLEAARTTPSAPINVKECRYYLALWQEIEKKDHDWERLSDSERSEVLDAIEDDG